MTPKEKAKELVDEFKKQVAMTTKDNSLIVKVLDNDIAKQCALIAVDEMIFYLPSVDIYPYFAQKLSPRVKEYWQEVKQEINKL